MMENKEIQTEGEVHERTLITADRSPIRRSTHVAHGRRFVVAVVETTKVIRSHWRTGPFITVSRILQDSSLSLRLNASIFDQQLS